VQGAFEPFELAQGRPALAVGEEPAHQREVGGLVGRLDLEDPLVPARRPQHFQIPEAEALARLDDPVLVRVGRKQVPAVQVGGCLGLGNRPRLGQVGGHLEPLGVDQHRAVGPQRNVLVADHHRRLVAQCVAGVGGGLVHPGGGLVDKRVGPQSIDHLLTMEAAPGGQGEQLDEQCAVASFERGVVDGCAVDDDLERAEQPDRDLPHRRRVTHRSTGGRWAGGPPGVTPSR